MKHTPVYEKAVIEALAPARGKRYIDATLGESGHLDKIVGTGADVLALDADPAQVAKAVQRHAGAAHVKCVQSNFEHIADIARAHGFIGADGILFDLGLSYGQIVQSGRGFSYNKPDEPLDMRLDTDNGKTAAELLHVGSAEELAGMFMRNAEEIHADSIARAIVARRARHPLRTVADLTECIDTALGEHDTRTYARIFQALRIAVNDEFGSLIRGLDGAWEVLGHRGILAVITFHSLEDRVVKRFITEHKHDITSADKFKNYRGAAPYEKSALLRVIVKQ